MKHIDMNIESLEDRRMMAGDVSVDVTGGGDLVLNGDNEANEVIIRALPGAGAFQIQGLNGTTINGNGAIALVTGVTDDLRINLRDGDNRLVLTGFSGQQVSNPFVVNDQVDIRTGDGDDVILINADVIGGNLRVRSGDGEDTVAVLETQVQGQMNINTGDDSDFVAVQVSQIMGRTTINTGDSDDTILYFDVESSDQVRINMGSGDDIVALASSQFSARFDFNGGSGVDEVWEGDTDHSDARYRNDEIAVEILSFTQLQQLENHIIATVGSFQDAEDMAQLHLSL